MDITDQELINELVETQVKWIKYQRLHKDQPLWAVSPSKEDQERENLLWGEALLRNLHVEINRRVNIALDEEKDNPSRFYGDHA